MCSRVAGAKSYELTDHLGNVKAVVSDRKKLSDEVREYRYSYGFESDQDQPGPPIPGWSWTFSTDPDQVYRGDRSTGVTGHAHIFVMDVQPGDTVSAEVMMKFTTGARGGYLYTAYQDANGENEIGASSDLYDLAAHQRINEWSKIYQPANVVPNGKYKLIVYLRVSQSSGHSPSWFDDFKISVKRGYAEPVLSAEVLSANSYYAFGSLMPKRSFNSSGYRYGFNGQEKDDEIKGSGNSYDFGARIYDPRIAKFLSPDPITKYYPSWSPYLFAGNNPIKFIDIYGMGPGDGTLTLESKDKEDIVTEKTVNTSSTTYSLSSSDQDYQKAYGKGLQNDVFKSNNLMINNSQPHAKMTVATTTTKVTYAEDGKTVIGTTTSQQVETRTMVQYDFYQVHSATGKDIYVGSVGDPMKTTSQDVANPAVSSVMSSFSNLITDYRAKTGISYTNVDEYAQDIMRQKSVVEAFDTYSPVGGVVIGALAKLRYGSAPSLAFGIATTGLQSSLERGLQTLEGKSNACQGCIKTYNIRNNGISKTPGYSK